jgi:tetratricopeptide (TPR) repeat protein
MERLQTIPQIVYFYLRTFLWPDKLAIAQHWTVNTVDWNSFYYPLLFVFAILILMILSGLILRKRNNSAFKAYVFFSLWFLGGLLLHLQIIPLDMTVADRWFYLPFVGLIGVIGVVIMEFVNLKSEWTRSLLGLGFGLFLIILSFKSLNRTLDWSTGLKLFSKDVAISGDSFDLQNNLGVELFRTGEYDEAKKHFTRSVEIAPYWWTNWNNLGAIVEREGKLKKAEEYYLTAINNGEYFLAYENYAMILIKQEKYDEAKMFLEENALLRFPYNERLNQAYLYIKSL